MNNIPQLLDLAIAIQQIPSPTFHEAKRAVQVEERKAWLVQGKP